MTLDQPLTPAQIATLESIIADPDEAIALAEGDEMLSLEEFVHGREQCES